MKITFKEVGQGDSIILEWEYQGKKKVGIIDCKSKGARNPVLEHIKDYKEIEFIILSHPHLDHYSGMEELLEYIAEKSIEINQFAHTIKEIGMQYWEWFEVGNDDSEKLARIIKLANLLYEKGLLKQFEYPIVNWQVDLADNIYLKSLSPSHDEIKYYQESVQLDSRIHKKDASRAANYLSTVFKLKIGNEYMLLTADAENLTFERIEKRGHLKGIEFKVCQLPHHGSQKNYYEPFWQNIETAPKDKKAIISAGEHEKYHHPDYEVVKRFHDDGYDVQATNIVNGMAEYLKEILRKTLILDSGSDLVEEYIVSGDKEFIF